MKERTKRINVRATENELEMLDLIHRKKGYSRSDVVRQLIRNEFDRLRKSGDLHPSLQSRADAIHRRREFSICER